MAAGDLTGEGAVRAYLTYLSDPESLRDEAGIKKAEAAVARAKDPVEKLRALSALEAAQSVSAEPFRAAFVREAKAWAEAEGVSASAFRALGVPEADLRDAGLLGARRAGRARAGGGGRTRSRVSGEAVLSAVPTGTFTLSDVVAASGASLGTVRKVVETAVDEGRFNRIGPDPDHRGRGRAPTLYRNG